MTLTMPCVTACCNWWSPCASIRPGELPKYLRRMQAEKKAKEDHARKKALDPDCPDGFTRLSAAKRQEAIQDLKEIKQRLAHHLQVFAPLILPNLHALVCVRACVSLCLCVCVCVCPCVCLCLCLCLSVCLSLSLSLSTTNEAHTCTLFLLSPA